MLQMVNMKKDGRQLNNNNILLRCLTKLLDLNIHTDRPIKIHYVSFHFPKYSYLANIHVGYWYNPENDAKYLCICFVAYLLCLSNANPLPHCKFEID